MTVNADWLVLVPTRKEAGHLDFTQVNVEVKICGFGPVVSAARTAALLEQNSPGQIMLVGIAGAYPSENKTAITIGAAYQFSNVRIHGLGVGYGLQHISASQAGWKQFSGDPEIGDELVLQCNQNFADDIADGTLNTVCSAAADESEVQIIMDQSPNVVAEDMEGFAVAAAARFAGVPVYVVRGISNLVGDRDHRTWRIERALQTANDLAIRIIKDVYKSNELTRG